jgi:DNA-binding NarL/FixJ family response regulator
MRIRQLLLIHPSRGFRGLINKFIFSECSDVRVIEIDNGQNALELLKVEPFNVVLVADRLPDSTLLELKTQAAETKCNRTTPFVVIAENENECGLEENIRKNFPFIVPIRLRPTDLIPQINNACNPRDWREHERYYLPNSQVIIKGGAVEIVAALINISMGGVLVELHTHAPEALMKSDIRLTVKLTTGDGGNPNGLEVRGKLSRLNIIAWHPDNTPVTVRATFIFTQIDDTVQASFERAFCRARKDNWTSESDSP